MSPWARAALTHVASTVDPAAPPLDRSLRVTLSFHPDRLAAPGESVLARLVREGTYRSQFETGTSNGGLSAHRGGARWWWEHRIFGGAYDQAPPGERPRYGALDHRTDRGGTGGAPRFGSAHLRLREAVLDRSTFCFPDSVVQPTSFATAARFGLWDLVAAHDRRPLTDEVEAREGGLLDDYVEAHVHGPVRLDRDVEALVLDPCFRGTEVEDDAAPLARLGVAVDWHEGRRLHVDELARHPAYRGPAAVEDGRRVAVDGLLDAAVIGDALRAGTLDPRSAKQLWHLVQRWGGAAGPVV